MNINQSFFKFVSGFLVGTILFNSVATAIAATTEPAPDWLPPDESFLNVPYTPLTPEERAAQRALADAKAEADRVAAAEKAAEEAAQAEADRLAAAEVAKAAAKAEADRLAAEKEAKAAEKPVVVAPTTEQAPAEKAVSDQTTTQAPITDQTTTDQQTSNQSSTSTSSEQTNSGSGSSPEVVVQTGTYTAEVKNTITNSLSDEIAKTGIFEVNLGGGKTATVTSEEEARKLIQIAAATDQTTNDLNGNGLDDAFEVQETGKIAFDETSKKEAVKKTVYGDVAPGQAVIVAVPETVARDATVAQVVGDRPFLKTRIEPKPGEDLSSVRDNKLEFKVYDDNHKLVDSQTVITDDNGVATYEPRIALVNGSYSMTTTNALGEVIAVKNIKVDSTVVPVAPVMGFGDMNPPGSRITLNLPSNGINIAPPINKIQMNPPGSRVSDVDYAAVSVLDADKVAEPQFDIVQYLLKAYIYKFYPYLDPANKDAISAAGINVQQGEVPKVIEGAAAPGTVVYVTWKSIVGYSVVIADAKGKFKAEAPADLAKGNHSVIAFVYDPKNNLVGNATSILFKK